MNFLELLLWGIVGMSLGSFVGALVHRYERGVSPLKPSACDYCGVRLGRLALVPVISWAAQGGRSVCCNQRLPRAYPLMEGGLGLFFLLLYGLWGNRWEDIVPLGLLASTLVGMSLMDWRFYRLPNGGVALVAGLAFLGAFLNGLPIFWESALLLGAGGLLLHILFKTKEGLGMGDVKLMAACGLWLPLMEIPLFLVLAGMGGILTSLLIKNRRFPFGPSLGAALMLILILSKAYSHL